MILSLLCALPCLALSLQETPAAAQAAVPEGFTALFNGRDLEGWWGLKTEDPAAWMALSERELAAKVEASLEDVARHWRVEDGVLVNDGEGLYLSTRRNYADFELRLEYKTVAKADSGIYLRGIPQVQIWDYTEEGGKWGIGADKGSGGLWNNSPGAAGKDPLVLADKPFGEWNAFRIFLVGERVTVFLNDELVVDHARMENYFDRDGNLPKAGPIQLQTHGGEIHWRNVHLREIGPDEADRLLAAGGVGLAKHDYEPLFNGRDLRGWRGPVDQYEVTEAGTLRCKPGKGGTIYTEAEYADFEVQLRFKLPPGGNNGLAIRYPGHGDTAYVGMCELQVLDNTAQKYATLHPAQYHGSIYGQIAARRGHLRPVGRWNFQQVTVQGPRIRVELNGFMILDADILEDAQPMYPEDRFQGRTRTKGHFGFAGHNDPVEYRDVRVRELK